MGRTKSYEHEPALDAAMGLDVHILHADFGSKQGRCEAALDHHARQVVPGLFPTFDGTEDEVRGCLICSAATELAPTPGHGHGAMDGYITRLAGAFEIALRNAQADGTVRASRDPHATARFLAGTLLGVFVMIRAQIDRAVVPDTVDGALSVVES